MKANLIGVIALFTVLLTTACGGNSSKDIIQLVADRDSLRDVCQSQMRSIESYGKTISLLNETFDSIAREESMIFLNTGETPLSKNDIRYNLNRFESVLNNQLSKVRQLSRQLKESRDSTQEVLGLISHMVTQVNAKNQQIAFLKSELEKKDVTVSQLQQLVDKQRVTIDNQIATINELSNLNKRQSDALAIQDAILNNGYVLIGSKDDLKRKGILHGSKLVGEAMLDRSKFAKIDIRTWLEVTFTAKRPRILSNMPASSYEISTYGNKTFVLNVLNPTEFWSITPYLVIQTD